jgi:6-phosphogluconolactonase/glucosamine-6-phosphate isomerase/deaminase
VSVFEHSERKEVNNAMAVVADYDLVIDGSDNFGTRTILESCEVVLIATGPIKREPLRRMLSEGVAPELPASILWRHSRCTILADREAATP